MTDGTPGTRMGGLFSLAGRTALVTGSGRGLGRGIAEAFGAAGADVACADRAQGEGAATAVAIRAMGRTAWELNADLSDRGAVHALAEEAERMTGGIDILVNCGGTIARHPAAEYPDEAWDLVMRTNLDGTFFLCRSLGAAMLRRGRGKIINIASLLSFQGGITVPAYTASKHAVAGVTKALANEWAGRGVQVNAIAPGYFATDNTIKLREDPKRYAEITARIPAGRWGTPADLAGAAVFLASAASDYVNGHVLVVDGGWMAR